MKRNDISKYDYRQIASFTVKCIRTTDKAVDLFTDPEWAVAQVGGV